MTTRTPMGITGLFDRAPKPVHKGVVNTSQYLTMRDGVKIAVDVMLPADRGDAKLPAVMVMARYWRSFELRVPDQPGKALIGPREDVPGFLIARGFAVVVVDARGTGASMGVSRHPWSPDELADYGEVARWVADQAWCNGNIGAYGISYEGATTIRLASLGVDAVKAVIPQEIEYDVYTDIAVPGGVFNEAFIKAWSESNAKLDNNQPSSLFPFTGRLFIKGVRAVDEDRKTKTMLAQALREHQANTDVYKAIRAITYRDDLFGETGVTLEDFSVYAHNAAIIKSGVPIFSWGSWLDGAAAESALRMFNTYSNPHICVIGAWKHEMTAHGSPYQKPQDKPTPLKEQQWEAMAQFFADTLIDDKTITGKRLVYYTLGAETWSQTDEFPLPNTRMETWHFQADHGLAPTAATASGTDTYTVDFSATTGKTNRWNTQMAKPLVYKDRAGEDRKLLTYTSAPLERDMTITGYPVVTLKLSSSIDDGAFFVYLEDVDPNGVVRYLTEGQLRGIHRKLSSDPLPYWTGMPNRSYKRADGSPLPVGETVELVIGLQPTSALIRRGHRIRVALAGADADTFARIPAQGNPVWTVQIGGANGSGIALPMVGS